MEIIERIYQTLSEKDKKAYELCEKLNIRTSTMSTWKARTNDPPAKYMKTRPKKMNCWRSSAPCRNLRNMNLSGNSKDF